MATSLDSCFILQIKTAAPASKCSVTKNSKSTQIQSNVHLHHSSLTKRSLKSASSIAFSSSSLLSSNSNLFTSRNPTVLSKKSIAGVVFAKQAVANPPKSSEEDKQGDDGIFYDCVIIGGGISGLCTAQALLTEHSASFEKILVTEARERVGGNITSVEGGDYLWEEGPNSFQPNDAMLKCVVDIGLKDELVLGDPDSPRFVFWGGRLRPVPAGLKDLPFFDLMSIFGKIRAGLGALGIRPPPPEGKEESVEEFVRRNLGAEVFERLIEPFCSGVYAGDPSKLSMKAAFGKVFRLENIGGSIIGGSFKLIKERQANPPPPRDPRLPKPKGQTVGSFRKGLATLPNAIAENLAERVRVQWKLTGFEKTPAGDFRLAYETPDGSRIVTAKTVLLTVPSYVAADLLRPFSASSAEALESFFYPPVAAVTLSYPREGVREDRMVEGELKGFGQLHPRSQGVTTLGTIYSSSLFPGRAPDGRVLLLCYIGGALNQAITSQKNEEIVETVHKDLQKMLIKENAPLPDLIGLRVWPRAIPQFGIGHLEKLESAKRGIEEAGLEGLFLGGNYVCGVALGRCVEGAYESAKDIAQYVSKVSK